jgi:hypothetical protein
MEREQRGCTWHASEPFLSLARSHAHRWWPIGVQVAGGGVRGGMRGWQEKRVSGAAWGKGKGNSSPGGVRSGRASGGSGWGTRQFGRDMCARMGHVGRAGGLGRHGVSGPAKRGLDQPG